MTKPSDLDVPPRAAEVSRALDEYLVVECQLGNAEAFTALVRRWHGALVLRAQHFTQDREVALEVAQESWIGIIRGLSRLRDPGRFRAWAMRIVANKARDRIRRERSRRDAAAGLRLEREGTTDPDFARVRDGLSELEPGQRTLLRRHYLEGHPVAEIAVELGVPEGTVKSRLHHARNQLRLCLEES
jgi:RNA polymerase sigma-70 factor (ECF subfamily)